MSLSNIELNKQNKLSKEEYQKIVYDWNDTDKDYPKDKTIYQLFQEQVDKNPNNIALVFEEEELTYKELNNKANQLARYIRSQYKEITNQELQADTLIPLCLERSLDMVVGILAVMKAGGAYVPMDPGYPAERFKHILTDTDANLIITQSHLITKLIPVTSIELIEIDEQDNLFIYENEEASNLIQHSQATDLAYVIYTSGTTGLPKGVMVEHGSVSSVLEYLKEVYVLGNKDGVTQFTSYVFDVSVSEIFSSLNQGSSLYILSKEIRKSPNELSKYLIENDIAYCYLPPVLLAQLPRDNYTSLKSVIYAGEPLDKLVANYWSNKVKLHNIYGPTEATIYATHKIIESNEVEKIGKAISNTSAYILDQHSQPVPVGVIGELYIGGAGLARGYLNRPELTAERFVPNLFATESDIANGYTRLYKTGDLVRWLSDGNIEYIGRNDFQVKIRGHRIELGEIENQLAKLVGIKQSIVLAQTNKQINSQYLVGYFVATELNTLSQEDLLTQLSTVLPDYMLPSILVELESLPLTVNGKLDRKALPNPEFVNEDTFVAPTSELEISLCNIFTDVLGLKMVGITDDFFRIGGNSILAIHLVDKIIKETRLKLTVIDILVQRTIRGLISNSLKEIVEITELEEFGFQNDELDLNHMEESIYFHQLSSCNKLIYNESFILKFRDRINFSNLQEAINYIYNKYEILKSNYIHDDKKTSRTINNKTPLVKEIYLKEEKLLLELEQEQFDLEKDPLLKAFFITKINGEQIFFIQFHHLVADATSVINILLPDLYSFIFNRDCISSFATQTIKTDYCNLVSKLNNFYQTSKTNHLDYLKDKIDSSENLFLNDKVDNKKDLEGKQLSFTINEVISKELQELSEEIACSLFSVLYSQFALLLLRVSSKENIAVRTNIDERIFFPEHKDTFGCFINNTFLFAQINEKQTLRDFIVDTQYSIGEALAKQVKFQDLLDLDREKVEQLSDIHLNIETQEIQDLPYEQTQIHSHSGQVKQGLYFELDVKKDKIYCRVEYQVSKYSDYVVQSLSDSYKHLLETVCININENVDSIGLLPTEDYQTIVYDWNKTTKLYPKDKTIYQLFQEQVDKNPNNIALVFEEEELTYKELNNKANQLARYIRSQYKEITNQELQADTLIPLCLERSLDMVVGILAVMKAGGAYVPMDPGYPAERFKHILTDTDANLIITQSHLITKLIPVTSIELIEIDEQDNLFIYENEEASNLIQYSQATDLAYVIYTSGTTGLPKGVLQTHGNVYRLLSSTDHQFGFNSNDIWTLYHSYIFDFSIWELWGSLTYGAKLVIPTQELVKDISSFVELCSEYKVTVLNQTPSAFYAFIDQLDSSGLNSLRYVIFGGDTLNINLLNRWWDYKKSNNLQTKLVNMYGITETTVHVTYKEIEQDEIASSNIGKPIDDLNSYILDQHNQPVPIGVIGELYIGGAGLARGYLNQPELTVERFISNPFATESDIANGYTRLYKTGDLVRWLSDGNIEYIGRNDFQVKIRGHRIELGEIENQLAKLVGIKQSIVLAQTNKQINSQYLVGYFVATELNTLSQEDLLTQLSTVLPDYMLPSILVELESLPLTVNGKLDRKALPNPEFVNEDTFVAPASELEISLCNIFTDVLGLEKVGITDDFFRIGGDSIVSIRLVGKMKKDGFNISVADIFTYRNIQKLLVNVDHAKAIDDKKYLPFSLVTEKDYIVENPSVLRSQIEDTYPASYLQLGMLIEYEKDHNYHIVTSYNFNKPYRHGLFANIFQELVSKHSLLRSIFVSDEKYGYLVITLKHINVNKKLVIHELGDCTDKVIFEQCKNNYIDLTEPGLFRINVNIKSDNSFTLFLTTHHAIEDGWSVASLISEFVNLYINEEELKHVNMPSYGKFVRNELIALDKREYSDFWKNYLADYEFENINFLFDKTVMSEEAQIKVSKSLDSRLSNELIKLSKELSISVDIIFLSAYQVLLSKLLNKEDVVIGLVVNNRLQEDGGDKVFGLHLNTIAFRNKFKANQSFEDFILATQENKHQLEKYKLYPYGKLKSDLNMIDDLYQCSFNYVHFHIAEDNYKNNQVSSEYSHEQTNIPFTLNIGRGGDDFEITLKASNTVIDINTAKNIVDYYNEILTNFVENKKSKIKDYSLLSSKDYQTIVYDWNKTTKLYPKDKTIYQLFQEQVDKNPNNIALVFEEEELTYKELNNKANQLARYIRSQYKEITNQELQADTLIPLCLERSLDMVVGILAVMKAGGAYVPMDPGYPAERFKHILTDTDANLIITQSHLITKLIPVTSIELIEIDEQDNLFIYENEEASNLIQYSQATDLAYVIYTSGTTGLPKGVLQTHGNVYRLLSSTDHQFGFNSNDIWTLYHSYIFDFSIWELWGSLTYGAKLVIPTQELVKDISSFVELCSEYKVTVLNQTPSAFYAFIDQLDSSGLNSLRYVIFGGDTLNINLLNRWWDYKKSNNLQTKLVNMYGITETTVHVTYKEIEQDEIASSNIGKPIDDLNSYILDQHNQPVPIGVIGELYIGGAGLARGYLNQPELTVERFISNPFATESDIANGYTRLYKTGDLVRWLSDGNIEYIGRNDFQVKIRGHRIELGEIENQLAKLVGIKQSIVLAQTNKQINSQYLVGYFVATELNTLSQEDLLTQLSTVLPDYMLPSILVELESLPLTVNGKLDRKALPNPEFVNEDTFVAPASELEISLCNIFTDVLGLEKVGITDDFFRIGGDSIVSIRLVGKMKKDGFNISVADIFTYRNIQKLLVNVDHAKAIDDKKYLPFSLVTEKDYIVENPSVLRSQIEDTYPASYLQLGMLIEYEKDHNYHIVTSYNFNKPYRHGLFANIFQELVSKHSLLRSIFVSDEKYGYLVITLKHINVNKKLVIHELGDCTDKVIFEQCKNNYIDLTEPGLFRINVNIKSDNSFTLFLTTHHAIEDGWSVASLISEFVNLYINEEELKHVNMPSYGKFVRNELIALDKREYSDFWKNYLADYEFENINFLFDKTVMSEEAQIKVSKSLDSRLSNELIKLSKELSISVDIIFLSAYQVLLSKLLNKEDVVIGLVVNNRLQEDGGDKVFGLHLNTIAFRNKFKANQSFEDFILATQENKHQLEKYKLYPYGKLKSDLNMIDDLYQCSFNYVHFHIAEDNYKNNQVSSEYSHEQTNIPFTLNIGRGGDDFEITLKASNTVIDINTAKNIVDYYNEILTNFVENKKSKIKDYSLLSSKDYQTIVYDWNKTTKLYPKDKTIYQLFQEQVDKNPNNIALVFEEEELTYKELNNKANQLARYIRSQYKEITNQELQADTLIPLCLERSLDMVVGILAVMKAGGAYVPMDPGYPAERFKHILTDTDANLIITQSHLITKLIPVTSIELIEIDEQDNLFIYENEEASNLIQHSQATDLAYVIYTSGTTGLPKGVMVEHGSVSSVLEYLKEVYVLGNKDGVTQFTSYVFDVSVSEIFSSLNQGSSLYILSKEIRKSPNELSKYLIENDIAYCYLPPVLLAQLPRDNYTSLKSVIYAGEPLDKLVANYWSNKVKLHNIYGPTEATIYATHKIIESNEVEKIGKAISNTSAYILDQHSQPVPVGVIGELYIGGAGLARGYLNRPELTAERFVPNLFATESDIANGYTRLYKTGDLVRWLSDGNIEYIGRNDFQVKIRGHRIELGEIENQLAKLVGIKQSIVLAQTNKQINSQYLVGYFVATELNTLSQEDLLTQLSTVLPDYMLPSILVELESLPLTVNGKLDRKALPNPEFVNEDTFVAPTSELEISLCNIFTDVLGLKMVGITDDFFRIGGNSILAIKLANILSKSLDTNVSVADIFTYKSISKLSAYITDNEIEHIVIPRLDLEQRELSFAQERLWFIEQYEGGSNAYHIPMLVSINDDINLDAIKQSISSVVQRHQVLRSVFKIDEEGNDYQVVLNDELVINEYSYQNTDISKQVDLDINTPFDLISNYPIRVSIYKEEDDTKLLINIHHIASDGWSTDILLKELNAYYDHYANNAPLELSSLSIQYKDFAVWQRGYLHGEELDKQLGYWQDRLIGYETLNLPTDYPRPAKIDYSGDNVSFEIDKDTSDKLRAIAKNNNTSLYSLMLSGFYVLLHKYSSQEDIVIGTPIANRHHTQTQDLIGFFVNSLGLREQLDTNKNIVELLNKVHNNLIEAQSHQDLPFERLVTALNVEQDQSRHPIFQVMFGLQSFGSENNSLFKSVTASTNYKIAKFDLECFIDDGQCNLQGSFNYATALYKKETVERLVESYQRVLNQLTENQETRVKDYSLLSSQDYQTIVYDWNKTTKLYPKDKTIYQLFQEQVDKNPNNIALVFEEEELTYKELNNKANQLARYIRSQYKEITNQELQADTLIPLCLERSLDMVVGILAVMKAGGAYVPMDPGYPAERFKHILTDTDANLIITQSHLITKLIPVTSIELIEIDEQDNLFIYENEEASNLIQHSQATDLAYVIYTSGTTGLPKGVLQTHGNVYRLLSSTDHQFGFNSNDIWTLYHSYIFDFSIWELWGSLTYGAKLVIPTQELVKDISSFVELCSEYKVTVLNQTPSAFYAFIDQLDSSGLNSLRYVIFGGDTLNINLLNRWWDYKKSNNLQTKLVNMYGITETTVHVTYKEIEQDEIASSNIGKPIDDLNSYILDQHNQPVPIGVIGELYIGGAGLARGYLNQPELTVERFISNPFATESDIANGYTRLYKTGDLVRWLSDGNIEYIGRNDFQVKIRGHRIELGEIENQLAKLVGIKQSIVLAQTNKQINSQYLVGYFVATELNTLSQEDLLTQLSTVLPDYMLPSILVELESLPLTVNGKLDRKALPNPEFVNEDTFVAPASELEISLCNIFTDVLGLEKVGITDDFFRIGGDSIVSIQLSSRLRKNGFAVSVRDIFDNRSVAKLATHIESNVKQEVAVLREEGVLTGSIRLLPIQEWFFDNIYSGKFVDFNHWNQSFMVKVPELDLQKIEDIIVKLINHHDILRVSYSIESNTQNHNQEIAIPKIKRLDINDYNNDELHNELTVWQSDFDIENGPLWSIGYLSGYADGSARLYFALHHLIVDAVSWRILIEDFKFIYNNEVLAPKATSYRQYSNLVTEYADNHNEQLVYWSNVLERVPTYPEISSKPTLGEVRLNKTQTEILLQQSSKAYHSEINDLLLVALALALQDWNGSARQGITLEGHGREHLVDAQDIGNTVGWFTTMYPVLLETQDDIGNTIKYIKESLRAIPDKGIGFGSFAINKDNDINFDQLPAISFNYLGQFDSKEGLWQLASEDSGISVSSKNQDHNIININGMVVDGQLSFSVVTQLGQDVTDKLSQSLQQSLIAIQEHTSELVEQGITYKTPSDYNDFIPYEIINPEINEDPIFIFPPANGGAESYYNNLVPKLKNKKLVLFNNYMFYLKNNNIKAYRDITYEDLAKIYVLYIKQIQGGGVHYLFGWSFGGVLAFEVARQFTLKASIVMLDSYFNQNLTLIVNKKGYAGYEYSKICNKKIYRITLIKANNIDSSLISKKDKKMSELYVNSIDNYLSNHLFFSNNLEIVKTNSTHSNIIDYISENIYLINDRFSLEVMR